MLTKQEIHILKQNAKVHKEIFEEIKKILKNWTTAIEVDNLCWELAKKHWVLCGFKWVYGFPNNICISVNDVVVHGRCLPEVVFKDWDLVTFDFWIKHKKFWINTDAAFSVVIGWNDKNPRAAKMIEANIKALEEWIKMARAGNTTWDIWAVIQKVVEQEYWFTNWSCSWEKTTWKTIYLQLLKGRKWAKVKSLNGSRNRTNFMRNFMTNNWPLRLGNIYKRLKFMMPIWTHNSDNRLRSWNNSLK